MPLDYENLDAFTTKAHENTGRLCDEEPSSHPSWGKQHHDTIAPGQEHLFQVNEEGHVERRPIRVLPKDLVAFMDAGKEVLGHSTGIAGHYEGINGEVVLQGIEAWLVPAGRVKVVRVDAPF
jgi:hypothetical protein